MFRYDGKLLCCVHLCLCCLTRTENLSFWHTLLLECWFQFLCTYSRLTMDFSVLLFLSVHCSYHWIKRKGKPAPREVAPIIVSNHVSYIEPIFYFYELFPTIVASESHDSIPFVGTIIRAMQVFSFHSHILCMQISNYKKLWYSTILCFIPLFFAGHIC